MLETLLIQLGSPKLSKRGGKVVVEKEGEFVIKKTDLVVGLVTSFVIVVATFSLGWDGIGLFLMNTFAQPAGMPTAYFNVNGFWIKGN